MSEHSEDLPVEGQDNQLLAGDDLLEQIAQRRQDALGQTTSDDGRHSRAREDDDEPTPAKSVEPGRRVLDNLDGVFVKAKVDGQEIEVPISEAIKHYQLDDAAERRFQQAKLEREQAAWERQQAEAERAALAEQRYKPNTPVKDDSLEAKKASFQKILDSLNDFEEEIPDEEFQTLFGGQTSQPEVRIDPAEIARQVRMQMDMEAAAELYTSEFADISQDPLLDQVAGGFLKAELQSGKTHSEAIRNAGNRTREWVAEKAGALGIPTQQPPARDAAQRRQQARANLGNTPTAANARQPIKQTAPPTIEQDRRARIQEMMDGGIT